MFVYPQWFKKFLFKGRVYFWLLSKMGTHLVFPVYKITNLRKWAQLVTKAARKYCIELSNCRLRPIQWNYCIQWNHWVCKTWGWFHKALKPIVRQIVSITVVICIVTSHFTKQLWLICIYKQSWLFVKSSPVPFFILVNKDKGPVYKPRASSSGHIQIIGY